MFDMRAFSQTRCRQWLTLRGAATCCAVALTTLLAGASAAEEDEKDEKDEKITIESLLKGGWQIAGYTSSVDNRSAFILFKHPSENYLVQCRAGYDVTREPREFSNCYKLR